MSKTVCSWCKAPLVLKDDVLVCSNTDCPACDEKYLHEELIRTRKALDVAVEELTKIKVAAESVGIGFFMTAAISALAKIKTALEQKQPTFVHNKIEFPEFNDNLLEEFDKQFFENGQDDDLTETALEQKD